MIRDVMVVDLSHFQDLAKKQGSLFHSKIFSKGKSIIRVNFWKTLHQYLLATIKNFTIERNENLPSFYQNI